MKTKSSPIRSLDPYPPLVQERFGPRETVPDTSHDERDVQPQKKRHCGLGTGGSESDACIVCEVSDQRVRPCCGVDCLIRFHGECLTPEFGGSDDLSNPFCPYCWLQFVSLKSESLREEAIAAEKAAAKYLDKDFVHDQGLQGEHAECSSKEDHLDKHSHQPEVEGTGMEEDGGTEELFEASSEDEERVAADNVQDAEGDEEPARVSQGRKRKVEMNATDSEISSTMELDGEDVSDQGASTNVSAQPNTLRNISFLKKDHRSKQFWTPKEEEMLKAGVEKYALEAKKNMPWRKILQMGKNVFHEKRKSSDLKDKWRNIIKA